MDTLFIGREILKFNELESTNSYLKNLNRDNAVSEGLTVVAEYQTSGRGQFGKRWDSVPGKNLLFSVYLRPVFLNTTHHFLLNMSVCLALFDSLNELAPGCMIKWPNDILYDRKKIAGVLIENGISGSKLEYSVVGIGLNVNQKEFPGSYQSTSLKLVTGKELSAEYVLEKILKKLEARYLHLKSGGESRLFRDYQESLYGRTGTVDIWMDQELVKAEILGVETDGRLVTRINDQRRLFAFNEIKFKLN